MAAKNEAFAEYKKDSDKLTKKFRALDRERSKLAAQADKQEAVVQRARVSGEAGSVRAAGGAMRAWKGQPREPGAGCAGCHESLGGGGEVRLVSRSGERSRRW